MGDGKESGSCYAGFGVPKRRRAVQGGFSLALLKGSGRMRLEYTYTCFGLWGL